MNAYLDNRHLPSFHQAHAVGSENVISPLRAGAIWAVCGVVCGEESVSEWADGCFMCWLLGLFRFLQLIPYFCE
jgi:hypothetical protein